MKTNTKLILGIVTGLAIIGFIILWDLVIKESIESEEVIVIKPGVVIHKYEDIQKDHLFVENRNRSTLIEGFLKPSDMNDIVGKQANQILVGNQLLSSRYIDFENFEPVPEKGESIRPIPNQWIYAIPSTVRRKDQIDIYLVLSDEAKNNGTVVNDTEVVEESNDISNSYIGLSPEQEQAVEDAMKKNENEDTEFQEERTVIVESKKYSLSSILGEEQEVLDYIGSREAWLEKKGLTENQWESLVKKGDIPLLVNVPVAYAKDGSGNEIIASTSGQPLQGDSTENERLTATGAIVNLELLLTEDNHRLLMGYINNGYRLYVTYN